MKRIYFFSATFKFFFVYVTRYLFPTCCPTLISSYHLCLLSPWSLAGVAHPSSSHASSTAASLTSTPLSSSKLHPLSPQSRTFAPAVSSRPDFKIHLLHTLSTAASHTSTPAWITQICSIYYAINELRQLWHG